jgi:hypothetical protein
MLCICMRKVMRLSSLSAVPGSNLEKSCICQCANLELVRCHLIILQQRQPSDVLLHGCMQPEIHLTQVCFTALAFLIRPSSLTLLKLSKDLCSPATMSVIACSCSHSIYWLSNSKITDCRLYQCTSLSLIIMSIPAEALHQSVPPANVCSSLSLQIF